MHSATLKNGNAERGSRIHRAVRRAWVDSRKTVVGFHTYRWIPLGGSGFSCEFSRPDPIQLALIIGASLVGALDRLIEARRRQLLVRDVGGYLELLPQRKSDGSRQNQFLLGQIDLRDELVSARAIAVAPVNAERPRLRQGLRSSGRMPAEKVPWRCPVGMWLT